jgi:hypothetical protein
MPPPHKVCDRDDIGRTPKPKSRAFGSTLEHVRDGGACRPIWVSGGRPPSLDRSFEAAAPNRKWIADFTYVLCLILRRRATGTDGRPLPSGAPTATAHRWASGFARPTNRLPAPDLGRHFVRLRRRPRFD